MKYIGITIGPIYETMKDARKTRELWNASYLFSFFMKRLLAQITDEFKDWSNVLVPYLIPSEVTKPNEEMIQELMNKINQKGVGLFHDRIIVKHSDKLWKNLKTYTNNIIEEIAQDQSHRTNFIFEELKNFYKNYIRLYMVVKEIPDSENPLLKINESLNNLELHSALPIEISDDKNYLQKLLLSHTSFLVDDGFGMNHSFLSIPEIATQMTYEKLGLKSTNEKEIDDTEFYKKLQKKKDFHFQHYHKYIAIVNADGDSISKVIEEMYQEGETGIKKFSKLLFEYAIQAKEIATKYGASVVYAGGDDILFFAPVKANDKTIFDICFELRKLFVQKLKDNQIQAKASLSFGVSITYYKYPLYEANKISHDLLMESKEIKDKNAITVQIIKHSGQKFKYSLQFDVDKDEEYKSLYLSYRSFIKRNLDAKLFRNIYTKIQFLYPILELANETELDAIFTNEFDKSIHKEKEYNEFLTELQNIIFLCKSKEKVIGILKTLDFYTASKEAKNETSN